MGEASGGGEQGRAGYWEESLELVVSEMGKLRPHEAMWGVGAAQRN